MREEQIPLTISIKKGRNTREVQKNYTFVFSPGGWELWQRKKNLLIEGLQRALAIVEQEDIPVGNIYVLRKALSAIPKEERIESDYYYAIVIQLKKRRLLLERNNLITMPT